ncbi:two-component system regulatory protein YycI [Lacticaseibacillus thailandensis]|uniref:Regulatory protein YycH-like domain-containing protein n=1 Tax=Lacticaseibacillus thailandensis DSM 22698 = JCM 13996 TaxID=1423810 RepID=A0A0R2C688_9LACO|nr:two-component system regulatory protein YycI [Lacticaseibacillus thailandensis]KRM87198.1 hypothetical protein FD19_GL001352 [Lacticaseibacillus thailandensis DSM 22698 = JCM 13996]
MDFRRIEWILLVVFLCMDIFLGWSLAQNRQVFMSTTATGATTETLSEMKRDQISLPSLSKTNSRGSYLAGNSDNKVLQNSTADRVRESNTETTVKTTNGVEQLTAKLKTPLALGHKGIAAQVRKFVTDTNNVWRGNQYEFEADMSSRTNYVFCQKTQYGVIVDGHGRLAVSVRDHKITGYTQTYVTNVKTMHHAQKLISAREAVLTLYRDNEIVNNSSVTWTKLGYTELLTTKGTTVYIPTWSVGISSKNSKNVTVHKVNAMSKAVIKER